MTLPVANLVQDALEVIYSVFAEDKTQPGMRAGVQALSQVANALNSQYPVVDIALTSDADDAGVSEFITAEADAAIGVVWRKGGTAVWDFTDNVLATAKGSALAANDIFVLDGADSVEYLGNGSQVAFDYSGETEADFVSIGS